MHNTSSLLVMDYVGPVVSAAIFVVIMSLCCGILISSLCLEFSSLSHQSFTPSAKNLKIGTRSH